MHILVKQVTVNDELIAKDLMIERHNAAIAFRIRERAREEIEIEKGTPPRRIKILIGRPKAVAQDWRTGKEGVAIWKQIGCDTGCQNGVTRHLEVTRARVTAQNRGPIGE